MLTQEQQLAKDLREACGNNDIDTNNVLALIEQLTNLNKRPDNLADRAGNGPLHLLASRGQFKTLRAILKTGYFDPNATNGSKQLPIDMAVVLNKPKCFSALLPFINDAKKTELYLKAVVLGFDDITKIMEKDNFNPLKTDEDVELAKKLAEEKFHPHVKQYTTPEAIPLLEEVAELLEMRKVLFLTKEALANIELYEARLSKRVRDYITPEFERDEIQLSKVVQDYITPDFVEKVNNKFPLYKIELNSKYPKICDLYDAVENKLDNLVCEKIHYLKQTDLHRGVWKEHDRYVKEVCLQMHFFCKVLQQNPSTKHLASAFHFSVLEPRDSFKITPFLHTPWKIGQSTTTNFLKNYAIFCTLLFYGCDLTVAHLLGNQWTAQVVNAYMYLHNIKLELTTDVVLFFKAVEGYSTLVDENEKSYNKYMKKINKKAKELVLKIRFEHLMSAYLDHIQTNSDLKNSALNKDDLSKLSYRSLRNKINKHDKKFYHNYVKKLKDDMQFNNIIRTIENAEKVTQLKFMNTAIEHLKENHEKKIHHARKTKNLAYLIELTKVYKISGAILAIAENSADNLDTDYVLHLMQRGHDRKTYLHKAASEGDVFTTTSLVAFNRAGIDDVDNNGDTALHLAAANGQTSICAYLLEQGATITKNDRGYYPWHMAVLGCHLETIQFFLENSKTVDIFNIVQKKEVISYPIFEGSKNIPVASRDEGLNILHIAINNVTQTNPQTAKANTPKKQIEALKIVELLLDYISSNEKQLSKMADTTTNSPKNVGTNKGTKGILTYLTYPKKIISLITSNSQTKAKETRFQTQTFQDENICAIFASVDEELSSAKDPVEKNHIMKKLKNDLKQYLTATSINLMLKSFFDRKQKCSPDSRYNTLVTALDLLKKNDFPADLLPIIVNGVKQIQFEDGKTTNANELITNLNKLLTMTQSRLPEMSAMYVQVSELQLPTEKNDNIEIPIKNVRPLRSASIVENNQPTIANIKKCENQRQSARTTTATELPKRSRSYQNLSSASSFDNAKKSYPEVYPLSASHPNETKQNFIYGKNPYCFIPQPKKLTKNHECGIQLGNSRESLHNKKIDSFSNNSY